MTAAKKSAWFILEWIYTLLETKYLQRQSDKDTCRKNKD